MGPILPTEHGETLHVDTICLLDRAPRDTTHMRYKYIMLIDQEWRTLRNRNTKNRIRHQTERHIQEKVLTKPLSVVKMNMVSSNIPCFSSSSQTALQAVSTPVINRK